jgi:type I restriction enzyme, S subunit
MVKFQDAVEDRTGGQYKVQKRDYLETGQIPIIDQGQSSIAGYTNDDNARFSGELPVVLFGDHTLVFKYVDFPFALGADGVKVLSIDNVFDPKYVFYYWQSRSLQSRGYSRHFKFLREIDLPLIPISEQKRIAEILDQAEALRKKRADADAKAARILPALFYKMFGDPAHWEANRSTELLGKLVDSQGGGTPSKQNPDYWGGDIPWVSPKDMKRDFIHDSEDHITQLALEETNSGMVPVNSILVVVRGMILARYVPLALNVVAVTINQDMKALQVIDERVSPLFLFAALKALGQRLHSNVGIAAHGTRKLDSDRLLSLPILIPARQKHVDFLARFKELRALDEKRAETAPRLERIFDVLLHRAFTGDLTAKWREANMKELYAEVEAQAKMIREASNTSAS